MTTWDEETRSGTTFGYILTPDGNYILVGSSEDETLIWQDITRWAGLSRNTTLWDEESRNNTIWTEETKS